MTLLAELPFSQGNAPVEYHQATSGNPAAIAGGAVGNVDIAVTGLTSSDYVMSIVPQALETGLTVEEAVCGTDKVTVTLFNSTGSSIDGAASAYNFAILRS